MSNKFVPGFWKTDSTSSNSSSSSKSKDADQTLYVSDGYGGFTEYRG